MGFQNASRASHTRVPVKTIDQIVQSLALPRVDILDIDIEGSDAAALAGAAETLKSVRYLQFEVHRNLVGTSWHSTTLHSVVEKLARQGFDCYWTGDDGKLLSLNQCWKDEFETGTWANAACVRQGDPWAQILASEEFQ